MPLASPRPWEAGPLVGGRCYHPDLFNSSSLAVTSEREVAGLLKAIRYMINFLMQATQAAYGNGVMSMFAYGRQPLVHASTVPPASPAKSNLAGALIGPRFACMFGRLLQVQALS